MQLLALLTFGALAVASPFPHTLNQRQAVNSTSGNGTLTSDCAGAPYYPSQYNCFDGQLCPVGTQPCGPACYDSAFYGCNNGTLFQVGRFQNGTAANSTFAPAPTGGFFRRY